MDYRHVYENKCFTVFGNCCHYKFILLRGHSSVQVKLYSFYWVPAGSLQLGPALHVELFIAEKPSNRSCWSLVVYARCFGTAWKGGRQGVGGRAGTGQKKEFCT